MRHLLMMHQRVQHMSVLLRKSLSLMDQMMGRIPVLILHLLWGRTSVVSSPVVWRVGCVLGILSVFEWYVVGYLRDRTGYSLIAPIGIPVASIGAVGSILAVLSALQAPGPTHRWLGTLLCLPGLILGV